MSSADSGCIDIQVELNVGPIVEDFVKMAWVGDGPEKVLLCQEPMSESRVPDASCIRLAVQRPLKYPD